MIFITHCLAIILCDSFKALTSTTASAGGNNRIAQLEEENRELKKGNCHYFSNIARGDESFYGRSSSLPQQFLYPSILLSKERYCKRD